MHVDKNEEQIEKEKDAVAKMVGAKSAMQLMIERHDRLVAELKRINLIAYDVAKNAGSLSYKTTLHDHKENGTFQFMTIKDQMERISAAVRKVT